MVMGSLARMMGSLGELFGSLKFPVGVDDLGPALALRFGLARNRPLHILGQVHLLHFHLGHLDAPGLGMLIENGLQARVELFALGEQIIQFHFTQHRTKAGLRQLLDR